MFDPIQPCTNAHRRFAILPGSPAGAVAAASWRLTRALQFGRPERETLTGPGGTTVSITHTAPPPAKAAA